MRIRSYLPVICFLCLKYFMYNLMSSLEEVQTNSTLFSKLYNKKNKQTKADAKQADKAEPIIDNANKEPDSMDSNNEDSLDMDVNDDAKTANDENDATSESTNSDQEVKDQNQNDDKQIDFDHSTHHYSIDNPSSI